MGELAGLLDQRIAVLDGAWDTMIQSRGPSAADYRIDGHDRDTAGDPDLLNITRLDLVLGDGEPYSLLLQPEPVLPPRVTTADRTPERAAAGPSPAVLAGPTQADIEHVEPLKEYIL